MNEPKYRKITIDIEDGNTVTHIEKDNEDFLKQYYQLQSNWNSLRELLENEKKAIEEDELFCYLSNKDYIEFILDKMNELEGKDKQ